MSTNSIKLLNIQKRSDQLINSFDKIPNDTYLKEKFCYRKRCYCTGNIENGIFRWNESPELFCQSEHLNKYVGGVSRQFQPISELIRKDIETHVIMNVFSSLPQVNYKVGVHQIRIIANEFNQGMPTPEGIHQDGFDFVAVGCINASNVSGGISFILNAQDHTEVAFEGVLNPGSLILFSDRTYAHYTSNISPKLPGVAQRDVVVATFQYEDISKLTH